MHIIIFAVGFFVVAALEHVGEILCEYDDSQTMEMLNAAVIMMLVCMLIEAYRMIG